MHSLKLHSFLARRQQSLLLRKHHPSSESNSFSDYSCRKQSYDLVLYSDQDKLWQISRESPNTQVPHVVSCPAGPWLMKEQTSWLLGQMSFPLGHTSSSICRIRGPKLKYLLIIYQTGIQLFYLKIFITLFWTVGNFLNYTTAKREEITFSRLTGHCKNKPFRQKNADHHRNSPTWTHKWKAQNKVESITPKKVLEKVLISETEKKKNEKVLLGWLEWVASLK